MNIGYDKYGKELKLGDLCEFTFENKEYKGTISYDDSYFAYQFEINNGYLSALLMCKAEYGTIKKID